MMGQICYFICLPHLCFFLCFAKVVTLDNFTALLSMQRSDCITHAIGANGQGAVVLLNQGVALDRENKRGQCNDPSEPLDERNCCIFSSSQKQHSRFAMYWFLWRGIQKPKLSFAQEESCFDFYHVQQWMCLFRPLCARVRHVKIIKVFLCFFRDE